VRYQIFYITLQGIVKVRESWLMW